MIQANTTRRRRRIEFAALCIISTGLAAYLAWIATQHRAERSRDANRLIRLKHVAVGALENLPNTQEADDGAECVAAFEVLAKTLPSEPIGPRNAAVARIIELSRSRAMNREHSTQRLAEAGRSLDDLPSREGDTVVVRLLRAKLAKEEIRLGIHDDANAVFEEYAAAARMAPDDPLIWSEWYLSARDLSGGPSEAQINEILVCAAELWPDNVALNLDLLRLQAVQRDPDIRETLQLARDNIRLFESSPPIANFDSERIIDDMLEAAERGDEASWLDVLKGLLRLANVIELEPSFQRDAARLSRHPLEFMIADFSQEFYDTALSSPEKSQNAIAVTFRPAGDDSTFPSPENVRHAHLVDFDLDGGLEVVCIVASEKGSAVEVFGRDGRTRRWSMQSRCVLPVGMDRTIPADLDYDVANSTGPTRTSNDGGPCAAADPDLIVYGAAGIRILRNSLDRKTGQRTLSASAVGADFEGLKNVLAAATADLDHDGDLDLALSTAKGVSLWRNHGDFQFVDISRRSRLPPPDRRPTTIIPVDWDRDVAIDLLLAAPDWKNAEILENSSHGRFRRRSLGVGFEPSQFAEALAIAETDGNASWDLLAAGKQGISLIRTITPSANVVRPLAVQAVSDTPVRAMTTWDYDNDGSTDILAWGGGDIQAYRIGSHGDFQPVSDLFVDTPRDVQSCDVGDSDGDGDLDLLAVVAGRAAWRINEGGNRNNWMKIALSAEASPHFPSRRTNINGIGSLVEIKTADRYQAHVVSRPFTHVGLGMQSRPDLVRVLFTNGIPQNVLRPQPNLSVCEKQRVLGTSCPYLYTWSGERFEFVTDLLWNAPLGLQLAEGVLAPSRPWEYLKIPGERLAPRDGHYELRMTEELWEAVYLDEVRLLAVDHPADVEIYSNEKVGPQEIAEFKIHTAKDPRAPIAARDSSGRDVLAEIAAEDDIYLKAFDRRYVQGLTEPHYLELDLGDLDSPKRITLFLTGWVFPGDTNLSVAISQDGSLAAPRPPSISVPDAAGHWRETIGFMGFPGGKTKTIAVDLSSAFLTNDYRLRIATTMELYWDAIFFTVEESPAEITVSELPLAAADLRYRGFSERVEHRQFGPESYRYDRASLDSKWPPMSGKLTRFGDVKDLLTASDDRFAVFGAGDEIALRFAAIDAPIPKGWKRDFIIYNAGWEKDANINTVYGQSVDPLPFRDMSAYPYRPDETFPDSPRHRDYLRSYQTREPTRTFWRQLVPRSTKPFDPK